MPAALVLLAVAVADILGHGTAVFYLFLLGIPVSGAGALTAVGGVVDARVRGRPDLLERVQVGLAGLLVAIFVVGAASRSPAALEPAAPGLTGAALVVGFLLVGAQAVAALVPERR